jgi:ABC-type amino acid transport substrate-binding protein
VSFNVLLRQLRLVICSVCLSAGALADGRPQLLFAYGSHNAPPIAIVNESSGEISSGVIYEMGIELAARVSATPAFKFVPRKRQALSLINGDVHVYCEWNPAWTAQADKLFWSEPMYTSSDHFMVKADSPISLTHRDNLKGLVIGAIRGFKYSPAFMAAVSQGHVVRVDVNSNQQNMDMLALKRVDAIIIEKSVAGYLLKGREDSGALRIEPLIDDVKDRYCAFSPKTPVSIPNLQKAAAAMQADGTIEKILLRYR